MASVRRAASDHAASKVATAHEVPEEELADESKRMEVDEADGAELREESGSVPEGVPAARFPGALVVVLDDDAGSVDAGWLAKKAHGELAASAAAAQEALEHSGAGVIVMRVPSEMTAEAAKQLLALADAMYLKVVTKSERSACETNAFEAFFALHDAHSVVVVDKAAKRTEAGASALFAVMNRHLDVISVR